MTAQIVITRPTSQPFTDIAAMIARELRRTVRSVDMLITGLALPALIMCVFVVIFGGAAEKDGHYIQYVVPAILILCSGFGSAMTAVTVAKDMREGIIDRFRTMPIFGGSVLVGHVIASVLRNLVASAVVIGVAVLLGDRPTAEGYARKLASIAPIDERIQVLGPAEAPLAVIKGRYRFRLLVKALRNVDVSDYLREWLAAAPKTKGNLKLEVDVDPQSFL